MAGVCLGLNRIVHLWVLLFRAFVSLCTHAQGEVKQLVFCQSASLSLKKASSRFYSIQAILLDRFCTWHNEGNCFHYYIVSLDNALFSPNQPLLCLLSYAQALQLGWNILSIPLVHGWWLYFPLGSIIVLHIALQMIVDHVVPRYRPELCICYHSKYTTGNITQGHDREANIAQGETMPACNIFP